MVLDEVATVSVDVEAAGFGVNTKVDPDGCPVRLNVTAPLKPLLGVIVTV